MIPSFIISHSPTYLNWTSSQNHQRTTVMTRMRRRMTLLLHWRISTIATSRLTEIFGPRLQDPSQDQPGQRPQSQQDLCQPRISRLAWPPTFVQAPESSSRPSRTIPREPTSGTGDRLKVTMLMSSMDPNTKADSNPLGVSCTGTTILLPLLFSAFHLASCHFCSIFFHINNCTFSIATFYSMESW